MNAKRKPQTQPRTALDGRSVADAESTPTVREYKNSRFAGEMLVAAELSRLGYEVALGNVGSHNTKSFDMTAVCPLTGHAVSISVKALKSPNNFMIDPEKILPASTYVFVMTGAAGQQPQFYVIGGAALVADQSHFFGSYGRDYHPKHGRGIAQKILAPFLNKWDLLERSSVKAPK
jgi:hypothetical protein